MTFTATAASHDIWFVAFTPDGPQAPTFQFLDEVAVAFVPEPSTFTLATLGLLSLGCLRRKHA